MRGRWNGRLRLDKRGGGHAPLWTARLTTLPWEEPFEVFTQMVWHEERWQSPALRAFLSTAREAFSVTTAPIV